MPKSVTITAPRWPSSEEEAKRLRISRRRQRELRALAEDYFKKMISTRKGAKHQAAHQGTMPKNASAAD
jgi:3-methyladenine DNA glycosylase/8-oxoguanine DNA glycosylase